jgi:hypothetical protein
MALPTTRGSNVITMAGPMMSLSENVLHVVETRRRFPVGNAS